MLLARRNRKLPLGPAKSRVLLSSRMCVKIVDIIPFRITTFRCSGSHLKTWDFNPMQLHTLVKSASVTSTESHTFPNCRVGGVASIFRFRRHLNLQPAAVSHRIPLFSVPGPGCTCSPARKKCNRIQTMRVKSLPALALLCAIALGACGLFAPPVSAQAFLNEVHATGSTHYTEQQIIALTGLKPGSPVTRDNVQAVANYLSQLGIFSRVNWTTRDADTSLVFEVAARPAADISGRPCTPNKAEPHRPP